ncbi:universal stress protein [Pseudomonas sp. LS44]|uniref:universal stress protein n=1 Tax=Pseudomonas sp. LS44 TaxID=1357074 RepID=UPI00215A2E02|nr:universal stress protein [Pseudomonas sp. LS44]UVE18914.1 universal stress protein [Pseudomonas sp. LS44]
MNTLMVATDLSSRSDRAVQRAALLAKRFACDWAVVHVIDEDKPQRLIERHLADAQELLESRVEGLALIAGRLPRVIVEVGPVEQTINEIATGMGCQLLILGMHRQNLLREFFVGTSAERIIRSSRLPVLRVGTIDPRDYRRVMLASDMSDCSAYAIQTTRELGLLDDSKLYAVHVFEAFAKGQMMFSGVEAEVVASSTRAAEAQAEADLNRFLKEQGLDLPAGQVQITEGFSVVELKGCIERIDPDLLVIGTHSRVGFKKLMLGSVAETLLGDVQCDVLCVPLPVQV